MSFPAAVPSSSGTLEQRLYRLAEIGLASLDERMRARVDDVFLNLQSIFATVLKRDGGKPPVRKID